MWAWVMGLDPLVQVGAFLVIVGGVLVAGVMAVERGFRREWELPAEPDSWAARMSSGEYPLVPAQPEPIRDQGHRTLAEGWRERLGAEEPGAAGGRHRHRNLGEHTQPINLARVNRRWADQPDPAVVDALRRVLNREGRDQL